MQFVIAKLVQVPRYGGAYKKEDAKNGKVLRDEHPVQQRYAEHFNESFHMSGKFYIVDEEKSIQYMEDLQETMEARRMNKESLNLASSDVVKQLINKGLTGIVQEQSAPKKTRTRKPKEGGQDATN